MGPKKRAILLFTDDDDDDRLLVRAALEQAETSFELCFAEDGQDLLDYLRRQGKYSEGNVASPVPDLILLDLNMPRKDGREALEEIKADPELRHIPVIILTDSRKREDIAGCYKLGADYYVRKSVTYGELRSVINVFHHYWIQGATRTRQEQ